MLSLKSGLMAMYPMGYIRGAIRIQQTETYAKWFAGLRERVARARIDIHIRRLTVGNAGDAKPVGEGVFELRVDHGPGIPGGVRFFVCEALRDLSTAAGVACDERPTRWTSRFDIVTQPVV